VTHFASPGVPLDAPEWKDYVSGQSAIKHVLLYFWGCVVPSVFSFGKRPVDYVSVVDNFVISSLTRHFEQIDTVELIMSTVSSFLLHALSLMISSHSLNGHGEVH